ncbi:hypothetical protein C0Q70_18584 [Pomacea canaliculata]|uniref:Cleavage/polyadenylation specificity factor A subunit C-terminal domain-containing protein n=1 Tax=Pomacea canaliculata TaxID=400727 RepID=A0A2T7NGX7_POMCA|nr:cleavage and polyadenylation specificity factor subunit 1-like [Pomacea canaliculata]PVD20429.1 hypothetical protein C0Q70_18584 [Pomacea canaliculata]
MAMSSSMFCMYKEIHPATAIEHSIQCNFFNLWETNLVIAGANQLHVYRLNSEPDTSGKDLEKTGVDGPKMRLECLKSFSLFGNIMSMQSVKLAGAQRDILLLSFWDAKLSVVEYDPSTHDLKTSSLHQFEEPDLREGFSFNNHIPLVRVDPDGRCAAMLIYGRHLVILPFRKEVLAEDYDGGGSSTKSPVMSSYIIDLGKLDEKIIKVLDVQFMHGYYEPTIFILFEPLPTWSGRVAVRADTCSIVAISINIQQKVHPVIWSQSNLPFDCSMALPLPKPIGGVLVFADNSLMYLNQSVPPYGVSLNSLAEQYSAFPLRPQENVKITLDCVRVALIDSDRCVLSLKGGELYVLTLVVDGMRSVRGFHFDKAASSVLTTCMCVIPNGYLFLGSRLGNSLLLRYQEKASGMVLQPDADRRLHEPPTKRRRVEGLEQLASDVSEIENLDELEVYGDSDKNAGTTLTSYVFEVCDTIWNIAPCTNMAMGEPAFLSEEYSNDLDPDLELVTTSGYGKNGAISVLQRSIRPQVVTTFQLLGCYDMWTVYSSSAEEEKSGSPTDEKGEEKKSGDEVPEPSITGGHAFLILSRNDSSMVLQTGQEINELDHSGFSTTTRTLHVANLGGRKYILQVSPTTIRLLEGVNQLQHIPIDIGSPIQRCSVADPYIMLMAEQGQVVMLTLKQSDSYSSGVRLNVIKPPIAQSPKIVEVCTYKDVSGMFTTASIHTNDTSISPEKVPKPVEKVAVLDEINADDEDEMLYGESDTSVFASSFTSTILTPQPPEIKTQVNQVEPTYWGLVARENGVLEIYSLPDFTLCYYVKNFPMGQKVLVDSKQSSGTQSVGPSASSSSTTSTGSGSSSGLVGGDKATASEMPVVKEILVVGMGLNNSHPYLMARVDKDLLIYEAFPFQSSDSNPSENRLKVRFKKYDHGLILNETWGQVPNKGEQTEVNEVEGPALDSTQWLRTFNNVSGYSGVFVCGPRPYWVFMTSKGSLRIHPMDIDGWVSSFAPFHNVNCPNGFLYFNKQNELRICVLPTHVTYDAPWPIRKVPLRCTPYFVSYNPDSKLYAVAISTPEPLNKIPKTHSEDRLWEYVTRDERFIFPNIDIYSVQLFTPSTWELIPNASYQCEEWERITTLKNVQLQSEGTLSGLKSYIAIGTTYCMGEEVVARGRVIILDIIEVVPEPGQPLTKTKMKVVYDKEQKGPVSALAHVNGFLLTAIGQKLYIWQLKDNDLSGVAFIDTHIYIHSLVTIKNLILAGDILKSITLYRYQTNLKVLSLVSRDHKPLEVYTQEFLVDNNQLCFLASDRNKNLIVYSYTPEARESHGGQRLLRKADFNPGSHINTMFRVRCRLWDATTKKRYGEQMEKRHITYFGTLDGGIGYLMPIPEKVYRRLLMLQNALVTHLPHTAGLNPKAFRTVKHPVQGLANPHRLILDGELIWKYLYLSMNEKMELARRMGTAVEQIVDDLMEIDRVTAYF